MVVVQQVSFDAKCVESGHYKRNTLDDGAMMKSLLDDGERSTEPRSGER